MGTGFSDSSAVIGSEEGYRMARTQVKIDWNAIKADQVEFAEQPHKGLWERG